MNLILDGLQLGEKRRQGHAVLQGRGSCILNDGAIGHGVAERNAHLNHVNATLLEGENHVGGSVEGGCSGTEIEREELAVFKIREKGVNLVHKEVFFGGD